MDLSYLNYLGAASISCTPSCRVSNAECFVHKLLSIPLTLLNVEMQFGQWRKGGFELEAIHTPYTTNSPNKPSTSSKPAAQISELFSPSQQVSSSHLLSTSVGKFAYALIFWDQSSSVSARRSSISACFLCHFLSRRRACILVCMRSELRLMGWERERAASSPSSSSSDEGGEAGDDNHRRWRIRCRY